MLTKIAQAFTWFFHPLLMPTIGVIILMFADSYLSYIPLEAKRMLIILTGIGTFILPALMIPLFVLQGWVSSIYLGKRKERLYPLAITAVFYSLTYMLVIRIPVFEQVHGFLLGAMLTVFSAFLISLRWKISTHMMGLGGLAALVIVLTLSLNLFMMYSFIGIVLAAGLAGSSRMYLQVHNDTQVFVGFLAGFVLVFTAMQF